MALIKLGSIVTDLAGSAGGSTIQNSRAGYILRNKPTPCNPDTSKQFLIRSKIQYLQRAWINLNDQQRQEWNEFPKWANQHTKANSQVLLNGHDLFLKFQLFRLLYGQPLLSTILYRPWPDVPLFSSLYISLPQFIISFSKSFSKFTYFPVIKLSKPFSIHKSFRSSTVRFMQIPFSSTQFRTLRDYYIPYFGFIPNVGDYVFLSIEWFDPYCPNLRPVLQSVKQIS